MSKDLSSLREEVTKSGFRPAPLAFLLHAVRRLVWPVVRQYHFFQLETLVDITQRLEASIEGVRTLAQDISARQEAMQADFHGEIGRIHRHVEERQSADLKAEVASARLQEWLEETRKLTTIVVTLRSDTAALANREAVLADDFSMYRQKADSELNDLSQKISNLARRVEESVLDLNAYNEQRISIQNSFAEQQRTLKEVCEPLASRLGEIEAKLESERAESSSRLDGAVSRFSDFAHDAVFRAVLPVAEARAEMEVLRRLVDKSATSNTEINTRVSALERDSVVLEQIAARQVEMTAAQAEVEWRSRLYLRETNGGLFVLKRGELISDFVASGQIWDPHVLKVASEVAAGGRGTAVDVGSHFGFTATALARHFDRVVCFEPNDFTYSVLAANIGLNGLKNIEIHHTALFSHECDVSLGRVDQQEVAVPIRPDGAFDGLQATNLGALLYTENGTGIFRQKARTLDSYQLTNVSFLKIDAQGADGEVLFGSMETLRRCRPVVIFEWEEHLSRNFQQTFDGVRGMLTDLGYKVELLHRTNEKQADYVARYP